MMTHRATRLYVRAEEFRSKAQNRKAALARLRWQIAIAVRLPPELIDPADFAPHRPTDAARLIDYLDAHGYSLRDTAAAVGITSSKLSAWIESADELLTHVNQTRQALGLRVLRREG